VIGEDVSEKKDGGVVRSQLCKGEGYLTPKEGATCDGTVSFVALPCFCYTDKYIQGWPKK